MTEIGDVPHFQSRGKFIEYFFEVVSAFGTVGLSMGVTAKISIIGKLILSCIMFIGRLGPLVIVIAVSRSTTLNYYNAEEDIMIG
jgi:trk system potassium uptake protein TrkH